MKKIFFLSLFVAVIPLTVFAFNTIKNPFVPLVQSHSTQGQAQNQQNQLNIESKTPTSFVLKMVMWGGLNAALLDDGSGIPYVVKEGTKIGNIRVIKILPYKVILSTPNGIQVLTMKPTSDMKTQKANYSLPVTQSLNKSTQNSDKERIENEVNP